MSKPSDSIRMTHGTLDKVSRVHNRESNPQHAHYLYIADLVASYLD